MDDRAFASATELWLPNRIRSKFSPNLMLAERFARDSPLEQSGFELVVPLPR
jgi:hypothetical protein